MTQTTTKMASLYQRLSQLGFPQSFIRTQALPEWWDEEVEETPGIEVEAAAYISRRLNLEVRTLLNPHLIPTFKGEYQGKFKTKPQTQGDSLMIAYSMAKRVGEMVAYACLSPFKRLPNTPQKIRREILSSQSFVNLEGLINWCWGYGLPVVYFDGFPQTKKVHCFEGMIAYYDERPVIILSLKDGSMARFLLILAHELGHLVQGHLREGVLVDEEIALDNVDGEEMEANGFAVGLLEENPIHHSTVNKVLSLKEETHLREENPFKKENPLKEQKHFREDNQNAPRLINHYLANHLVFERLDEDSQAYLRLIIGE